MSRLTLSQLYWGSWIFVQFLVPEILAVTSVIPMYTLSRTSWMDEQTYPVLRTIIFGFLMGLAVHIRFKTSLGRAELGGIGISLLAQLCWGLT